MANVQLQRQQTITTAAIAQEQSQEVVQTIVHGGLSSLSYLREFFPDAAFIHRVYGEDDVLPSYEDYAAGKLPKKRKSSTSNAPSTNMQLLQRGKSRRVDKLLDWLEYGAFPAINSGNLRALHVFVHADPIDRSQVIESYTFTVRYIRDTENQQVPTGIELGKTGSETVTVGATSSAVQDLIRQINGLCEHLPQLPSKRYVSMALIYNEDNSVPDGWTAAMSNKLLLGGAEGWSRHDDTFDDVFTAFHETSFEISYLRDVSANGVASATAIPEQLTYTEARPMLSEGDIRVNEAAGRTAAEAFDEIRDAFAETQFPEVAIESPNVPSAESVATQSLPPDASDTVTTEVACNDNISSLQDTLPAELPSQTDTQSSNVAEMKEAFIAMMQPEHVTQGDTQTQAPFFPPHTASETTASPSPGDRSPSAFMNAAPTSDPKLVLSETTAERLEHEKSRKRTRAKTKAKGAKRPDDDVYCSICEKWQHLHCYGFTGEPDPRIPDDHACYQCLLGTDESQTLDNLRELMKKRRVMHALLHDGARKASDVANSMQLKVTDTESILSDLDRDGYLVVKKGAKKASANRTTYSAVKSGPMHERMLRELFDPLVLISHHYQTPKSVTDPSLSDRLADTSALKMPPPTTPASRLMRLAQTSGTARDVSGSASPSETPSKTRNRPLSGVKRPRQEAAVDTDTASRVKRVQTQFILDAGGLPSSPASSTYG